MVGTDADPDPPTISGAGPGGTWIGVKGTPFSQTLFPERPDRMTTLLELGYRFSDWTNFYTTSDQGSRGGGPGSAAWRASAAFSTTHHHADPYLKFTYEHDQAMVEDVKDDTGAVLVSDATVNPADNLETLLGAELRTYENETSGAALDFDFFVRAGYTTWQDVPSGIYLPSVMASSDGQVVTQSDMLYARGGVGVDWQVMEYLEWDVAGEAGTRSGHRLEYPYDVSTGDSFDYAITDVDHDPDPRLEVDDFDARVRSSSSRAAYASFFDVSHRCASAAAISPSPSPTVCADTAGSATRGPSTTTTSPRNGPREIVASVPRTISSCTFVSSRAITMLRSG